MAFSVSFKERVFRTSPVAQQGVAVSDSDGAIADRARMRARHSPQACKVFKTRQSVGIQVRQAQPFSRVPAAWGPVEHGPTEHVHCNHVGNVHRAVNSGWKRQNIIAVAKEG